MAYLEGHIIIKRVGHIMHRYEAVHGGTDEAAAAVEAHLNAQMHEEGGGGGCVARQNPFFMILWPDARTLMDPHGSHGWMHGPSQP